MPASAYSQDLQASHSPLTPLQVQALLDDQWQRALRFASEHRDKIEALVQELKTKQVGFITRVWNMRVGHIDNTRSYPSWVASWLEKQLLPWVPATWRCQLALSVQLVLAVAVSSVFASS
jgi:GH25 family lysozyme M1 (1,4-beta-N-acetylmuramidase)